MLRKNKIIQMTYISPENSLFIIDFDVQTNEIIYRDLRNKEQRKKEMIIDIEKKRDGNGNIIAELAILNSYHIPVQYIQKFVEENNLNA